MSRSHWLHHAALGCVLAAALLAIPVAAVVLASWGIVQSAAEESDEYSAEGDEAANENGQPNLTPSAVASPQIEKAAAEDQRSGKSRPDYAAQDLMAQQQMALSTDEMVKVSWLEFYVACGALTLSFFTVIFAWWAASAARDAAEAAQKAVVEARHGTKAARDSVREAEKATAVTEETLAVTRKASENELRAYVELDRAGRTRRDVNDPWVIEFTIKNYGITPAYGLCLSIDHAIVDRNDIASQQFDLPPSSMNVTLAPSQIFTGRIPIPELSGHVWSAYKAYKKVIFLWGRMDFTDAFGAKRWVTFRMFQEGGYVLNLMAWHEGNESSESPSNKPANHGAPA